MRYSETWLREWVNPPLSIEKLADALTMSGIEVEEILPAAGDFAGVIIGEIKEVKKHPESDQLFICQVDIGNGILQIVTDAVGVRAGMKTAIATPSTTLGKNKPIKVSTIRSVSSEGMFCSSHDLEFSDKNQELVVLPTDAPLGVDLRQYLELKDQILNVSITPNRGDCLSIRGLAREIAAITESSLSPTQISTISPSTKTTLNVELKAEDACPRYVGRVIEKVNNQISTPIWLQERLRRLGARSINAVVDVMNYVMYEIGQPMHAFDLQKIENKIVVRYAKANEKILLLDESEQTLEPNTLVIADESNPIAIAGVMGGFDSGVTQDTQTIFLESAFFTPPIVARQRQHYGINSEAAYRFERGVDPFIQQEAIERATQLILSMLGGKAGPIIDLTTKDVPRPVVISLKKDKIKKVLGIEIADEIVLNLFKRLHFSVKSNKEGWDVTVPSYRFDLSLPEDLIEELARLYGYEKIPTQSLVATLNAKGDKRKTDRYELCLALMHQGYHEIISYSFIDTHFHRLFHEDERAYELLNPISNDMTIMRTSLLPGLMKAFIYNQSRQQDRIRLFEMGTVFIPQNGAFSEEQHLSGLISGKAYPEQWAMKSSEVDFYDIKGDIEHILHAHYPNQCFSYRPLNHKGLHPGQSAAIYLNETKIGMVGALHPILLQSLDLSNKIFIFEINLSKLKRSSLKSYKEVAKFPEIRRDIAILIDQAVPAKEIQDTIKEIAGDWLKEIFIFDVYQGKGISPGLKSVALALVLQSSVRTLVDDEVAELMERIITTLKGQLGAELRS